MARKCKSLYEAIALIKSAHSASATKVGKDMVIETRKIVGEELIRTGNGSMRTGATERSVDANITPYNIRIFLDDTGAHKSVVSPNPSVYLPAILESGNATYMPRGLERGETQIEERVRLKAETDAPNIYVRQMRALGINAYRK